MCNLDSDVARSSKDIQRIELKPNTQLWSTGKLVTRWRKESLERTKFDRDTLGQEKHDEVTNSTSMVRPVCVHEYTKLFFFDTQRCWKWSHKYGETRFGGSKRSTKLVPEYQDCHTQSWKKQNISEFKNLWKRSKLILIEQPTCSRITSTIHSAKIQRRWSANWVTRSYWSCVKPTPKVQWSHCLLHWNQGIVYCTCAQRLTDSESRRKFNKLRLDELSIPNYVINRWLTHGARHGKTEAQREYHLAWNAWKRCCKKDDFQGDCFTTSIHDGLLRDSVFRESQLAIGWSEQKCKEWDQLAKKIIHSISLQRKRKYTKDNGKILWKTGKNRFYCFSN